MNKITINEEIEKVELRQLKPGQIFEYNTNYYMKMKSLGTDFVRDVGSNMFICELDTGNMTLLNSTVKVKPIYGKVEILVGGV